MDQRHSTPVAPSRYASIESVVQQHEGSPGAVAEMIGEAVRFIDQETRRSADPARKAAIVGDLKELQNAFDQMK